MDNCGTAAPVLDRVLRFVGEPWPIRLRSGRVVPHLNFDWAATTPALIDAKSAVDELLLWYGSGHRGTGAKSHVSTAALECSRAEVASFVGARSDDVVIFTRHTTDALNLLAGCLPPRTEVVTFDGDHHANLLPWRGRASRVRHLPTPRDRGDVASVLDQALKDRSGEHLLVALTGASNVTGEVWPVRELVTVAHSRGARVVLDAAQLVGHLPVDVADLGVDYVAFSGHKMYAPFGTGALVGRRDWLDAAEPPTRGGGAVYWVSVDDVDWCPSPARHEAGSPNTIGAVALAAACGALRKYGRDRLAAEEEELAALLRAGLASIDGVTLYGLWDETAAPRVGITAFNLARHHHDYVAAALADRHGISVRSGCFCAHPLLIRLLGVSDEEAAVARHHLAAGRTQGAPGAVRASLGPATTEADVVALVSAIAEIAA